MTKAEQARWLAANAEAIDQYNAFIERYGLFSDELASSEHEVPQTPVAERADSADRTPDESRQIGLAVKTGQ